MGATRLIDVRAPEAETEGTRSQVLRWLKTSGESITRDEPLLEVETDKVTVEIASPAAGVLREVLKQAEEEIAPGELLARIEVSEASTTTVSAPESAPALEPGHAPAEPHTHGRRDARAAPASRLSPAVKRLLAEHGLDAGDLHGSGRGGQITVDDVLAHANRSLERQQHGAAGRLVPHSPMRKRIAEHMVRSLQSAPHVTTMFEADFSAVLAHRTRNKDDFAARGAPLTLTAYILAACVDAIRAVPEANARWTDEALEIFDRIDIGVGTALPDHGLIVPVVREVDTLSLLEIAGELGRLVGLAHADRLSPRDVRGGTFTISNHGVSGSLLAAPIVINQPQTAILGIGRIEKRPVVIDVDGTERIIARPRAYLTLTIDHRVMDGHRANQFLEVLVRRIESWPQSVP